MNFADRIRCPTFLFHTDDDSNVPLAHAAAFHESLKAAGNSSEFFRVPVGGHAEGMIKQGIPAGVSWLKKQAGL